MKKLFELLAERGFKRTSLSVQKDNPAVKFYERLGYTITDVKLDHAGHEDYIMVRDLKKELQNYGVAIGICLGLGLGTAIGVIADNIGLWVGAGLCLGIAIGSGWYAVGKKKKK